MTHRVVEFIQYDEPALKAGQYTITAHQQTPSQPAPNDFHATRSFAVAGERFRIDPAEIAGVFPPDLANGEYQGALPHVLFSRRTLPWERTSVAGDTAAPWLAVLLFDDGDAPTPVKRTAKELVPAGHLITVTGSTVTGTGSMDPGIASYPGFTTLDYGETPDDDCMTIDLGAALFSRIAPSAADLHFLAHIREADTLDAKDTVEATTSLAVVLGNRVPLDNQRAHAFLVSLEELGPLLPAEDGTQSAGLTAATVRLLAYRWWTFTANTMGETFAGLLQAVDSPPPPGQKDRVTSLQVQYAGPRPGEAQVQRAMNDQAAGALAAGDADALVRNAFAMGYLPLGHQLRHGGLTVSWYRGPLAPYAVKTTLTVPLASADAALRYDPQTGMLDVSYAAAWQLGRLLALQNESFAMALYNWRRHVRQTEAIAAEQALIAELLGEQLPSVTGPLARRLEAAAPPSPPHHVVRWLAHLRLFYGVPFNYLVPDERMLPPESLCAFHVDRSWVESLLDGAFSIGRATTGEHALDAEHAPGLWTLVEQEARGLRPNRRPDSPDPNPTGEVTGFLLRSQAVAGWPHVDVFGYSDPDRKVPVGKLRLARLGGDVMLGLFDGVLDVLAVHEAPGQLHCGVEGLPGSFTTTLREVNQPTPGYQYVGSSAPVVARSDQRTLMVASAAAQIQSTLETEFKQVFKKFTAAELALELIKGVSEVEFRQGG